MVGSQSANARLARGTGGDARPVPCLAFGGAAAADDRPDGDALLPGLHAEVADGRGSGRRFGRSGDRRVRRPRLLFARAQPARVRQGGCSTRRKVSEHGGRAARPSGHRRLHGGGDRRHRLRPPGGACRRRHCAHPGAPGRARAPGRRGEEGHCGRGASAGAPQQGWRFRPGAHGYRRGNMPATQPRVRRLSAERILRRLPDGQA